jgi:hypothetical protein
VPNSKRQDNSMVLFVASRVWNSLSGLLTLWLIARRLSPLEQGFYYLLVSLGALQMFAELGLGVALTNLVSPEMAQITLTRERIDGPIEAINRLYSLEQFGARWFNRAAVLLSLSLPVVGWLYLSTVRQLGNPRSAFAPWTVYVLAISVALIVDGKLAFALGVGKTKLVGCCRFQQAVVSSFVLWFGLNFDWGLYALGMSVIAPALVNLAILRLQIGQLGRRLKSAAQGPGMNWRSEIWPFQWKIGLSFLSGFFIAQSVVPIVLRQHGAAAAGRVGISLQIVMSINAVAFVWIGTRSSSYGALIERKDFGTIRHQFLVASLGSLILILTMYAVAIGALAWAGEAKNIADRVLPFHFFVWMCLLGVANHVSYIFAVFLRALRTDPLWLVSILHGLVTTVALVFVSASTYAGVLISLSLGTVLVGLPGSFFLFLPTWKRVMAKPI